jgi:hypothetical protein
MTSLKARIMLVQSSSIYDRMVTTWSARAAIEFVCSDERFSVSSSKPFGAVVAALKPKVRRLDLVEFAKTSRFASSLELRKVG